MNILTFLAIFIPMALIPPVVLFSRDIHTALVRRSSRRTLAKLQASRGK